MNTSAPSPDVLQFKDMRFRYAADAPVILQISELVVPRGQFVSLLGASGSGKSTLLRLIAGLLHRTSGSFHRSAAGSHDIGLVFQNANLIPWRTARENVTLPAELGSGADTVSEDDIQRLFRLVGLQSGDAEKRPSELSGGMQMRVSLARALSLSPSLLLLDEPFGAIDDVLRMQLEEEVRRIHDDQNLTTILVTHNISEAVFMSDRILVLGGHPSTIMADVAVDLPQPRDRSTRQRSAFHEYHTEVMNTFHAAAESLRSN